MQKQLRGTINISVDGETFSLSKEDYLAMCAGALAQGVLASCEIENEGLPFDAANAFHDKAVSEALIQFHNTGTHPLLDGIPAQ